MESGEKKRSAPDPVRLIFSIDVEEEGLFRGQFPREHSTVGNVPHLMRLVPALARFSLPVTLLCTHRVFTDKTARAALDAMRKAARVEIAAHLHHWDTPPFEDDCRPGDTGYICPGTLAPDLFRRRLESLFAAGRDYSGTPLTSFRMGRWHLHRWHWPYLAEAGVLVDSSVRPLHYLPQGPDFFNAPAAPYYVPVNGARIIESPMTCIPLYNSLPGQILALERAALSAGTGRAARAFKAGLPKWGVLNLTPIYHPLWLMKLVTRIHLARGGRFLSLTCHSSELMPGGTPHLPDQASVAALMARLEGYFAWLHGLCAVQGMVLDDLRKYDRINEIRETDRSGDWIWRPEPDGGPDSELDSKPGSGPGSEDVA